MDVVRVNELWQRAGVYYVRTEAMVKGFNIPLDKEFDQHDTPETQYVLILDGVFPVAACRLHRVDDNTAKIERVCVLENYRGKGTGKILIRAAEDWLKEMGVKKVIITSRDEAVGFYEKLGYKADWNKVVDTGIFVIVHTDKEII